MVLPTGGTHQEGGDPTRDPTNDGAAPMVLFVMAREDVEATVASTY